MFYLEKRDGEEWTRLFNQGFKFSEYAKGALKSEYEAGRIARPERWTYRVVDYSSTVYFTFDGMSPTGRFMWASTPVVLSNRP